MFDVKAAIWILFLHFAGDFVFQTDWMAKGKSKAIAPMAAHIATYTLTLFLGSLLWPPLNGAVFGTGARWAMAFALINGGFHAAVDSVTSRVNAKLWADGRVHAFFVGVGFDQFLHVATLFISIVWLSGGF